MREAVADERSAVERRMISAAKRRRAGPAPPPAPEPRRVKVNTALRFYHEVVGLDHLHYGLWNGEPLTLDGLKIAQDRFSRHPVSYSATRSGAPRRRLRHRLHGTDAQERRVRRRGPVARSLPPERLLERTGAPFHLSRFQEFQPPRPYDLVLMSESAQYIWLDRLFPAVIRRRAAGGSWSPTTSPSTAAGASRQERPSAAGFIGTPRGRPRPPMPRGHHRRVAPTLDLARTWVERYVDPCLTSAPTTSPQGPADRQGDPVDVPPPDRARTGCAGWSTAASSGTRSST